MAEIVQVSPDSVVNFKEINCVQRFIPELHRHYLASDICCAGGID